MTEPRPEHGGPEGGSDDAPAVQVWALGYLGQWLALAGPERDRFVHRLRAFAREEGLHGLTDRAAAAFALQLIRERQARQLRRRDGSLGVCAALARWRARAAA